MRHGLLAGCAALGFGVANAAALPKPDFELSDGRRFVRLSELPAKPTVVNFWRADCPPCVRELPLLAALAREGKVRVVTVALQRQAETMAAPTGVQTALHPPLLSLHGPGEPRGLLARFGNPVGALPHTVWLGTDGRVCARKTGEIDAAWLAAQQGRCGQTEGE